MTNYLSNDGDDMSGWDLAGFQTAAVVTHSATKWVLSVPGEGGGDAELFTFSGTGLIYDANNRLTGGTITKFTSADSATPATFDTVMSAFSLSGATLRADIDANDAAGLQKALFDTSNDSFTGSLQNEYFIGYGGNDKFDLSQGGADTAFGGGAGNDVFHMESGGSAIPSQSIGVLGDSVFGEGGDDSIYMGARLTADSQIDGGAGYDTLYLNGDYSAGLVFQGWRSAPNPAGGPAFSEAPTIRNVEKIVLATGHSYDLTADYTSVAYGATLTVDGSALGGSNALVFNGGGIFLPGSPPVQETYAVSGSLDLIGGKGADSFIGGNAGDSFTGNAGNDTLVGGLGDDVLVGGAGADTLRGGAGSDTLTGGAGADTFVYGSASDSNGGGYDHITDFDFAADRIAVGQSVGGIDKAVKTGSLSDGTINHDLSIAASGLGEQHAMLFTANGGTLSGHTFLIVDLNGVTGYQSGHDLAIDVTGGVHFSSLSVADFV